MLAAVAALAVAAAAQERDRAKSPEKFSWNLADIYPTDGVARSQGKLAADLPKLRQFRDTSPRRRRRWPALETLCVRQGTVAALCGHAGRRDTRDATHQGMRQEMVQVSAAFAAEGAFIEPELLRAGKPALDGFLAAEPRLKIYRFYLEDVARRAAHTLSGSEEKILAAAGPVGGAPSETYGILTNADFPYPSVTLGDGRTVKLDQAAFTELRALPVRADREKVMAAFFKALGGFSRTFGTTLNGEAQKVLFFANARKYPTAVEMALDGANIPVSVYTRLVDGVNRNLPAFHRYLKLRKRVLALNELH
jgi:oligoendopeptidase F